MTIRSFLREWVLSPGIRREIGRLEGALRSPRLSSEDRAQLQANARLHGRFAGRRCFVVANGPSLSGVDLSLLSGEITIAMNHFNRHPVLQHWEPTVHCAAEPAEFYEGPEKLDFLRDMVSGYTSTTHVFPIGLRDTFVQAGIIPRERLVLVRISSRPAAEFHRIDLSASVPSTHDTSILAVSVALAMGCSPIVLVGLDYNWLDQGPMGHFYREAPQSLPERTPSIIAYPDLPYLERMRLALPRWEAHAALARIGAASGQVIVNASARSYLDVYPFTTFDEALAMDGHLRG